MQDFFLSTGDDGFVTLTYYTSGARSFYTKDKAIRTPADLKGLKIRVQDMKSQTDMMNYLGGIPVAMSYGDVYTSLQTGIIDGTENNETRRSDHERKGMEADLPGRSGDHSGSCPQLHRGP